MEVALWVPAVASLITGLGVYFAATRPRKLGKEEQQGLAEDRARQESVALVAGFAALVNELQEERDRSDRREQECQAREAKLRAELAACLQDRLEHVDRDLL